MSLRRSVDLDLQCIGFTIEDNGVLLGVFFKDDLVDELLENLLLPYFIKDLVNELNGVC
jgi:hypothetical protein